MLVFVVKNDWVASLSHKTFTLLLVFAYLCCVKVEGFEASVVKSSTSDHGWLRSITCPWRGQRWSFSLDPGPVFDGCFFFLPRVLRWFNRDTRAVIKSCFFLSSSFYLPSKNILRILIDQPGFVEYHKSFGSTTHVGARCKEGMAPVGGKLSYFFQPTPCAGESLCSLWCGWAVSMYM